MFTRTLSPLRPATAGVAFLFATLGRAQEVVPTPVAPAPVPEAEAPAAPASNLLPCAPAPTKKSKARVRIPLPAELQGEVRVLELEGAWVSHKLPPLKPWVLKELRYGPARESGDRIDAAAFESVLAGPPDYVDLAFAFRLAREDDPGAASTLVSCEWGMSAPTGFGASGPHAGVQMRLPGETTILCELFDAPGTEPWRLRLRVGRPSNPFNPEFYSRGALVRGEASYKLTTTNTTVPSILGLRAPRITGTFLSKDGKVVAAVERLIPGRVVLSCATSPAEESLFVAVGAALLLRDVEALPLED